ncbi:MAG: HAD family hydrolase [Solirubrobacteraceae bacterium]
MTDIPGLVIFDCDGVLVDSEPISNEVLAVCLTEAGLPTSSAEAMAEYRGRLMDDVVARAQARLGAPLPPGFVEDYERARVRAFELGLRAVPGAAGAVAAITAAGVKACVASQGRLQKTELTLELTGLRPLFGAGALFSAYSVARGKPHPDLFLYAAAQMGERPGRTVVVEDTPIGVAAAIAAGMRVVGYAADDGEEPALRGAGAVVIGSLPELPALIGLGPQRRNWSGPTGRP